MQEVRRGDKIIQQYDSLLDFAEYAEGNMLKNAYSKINTEKRIKFAGGSWEDALTQAKTGNPELVTELFNGVNIINAMIEEDRVGEIRDVTGEYFDVADYLSGEPEVFRREEYGDHRPVVPVYANFGMNHRISNTVIKNRGCGIIALCDELAKSGFIVDLNMVKQDTYNRKEYYTKIHVALDPLDLDAAAYIIANPMCHRRLWFSILERSENKPNCSDRGYGYVGEYDLDEIFATGLSGFYFVSSNHGYWDSCNYTTTRATKEHIMDMVQAFKEKAEQVILG